MQPVESGKGQETGCSAQQDLDDARYIVLDVLKSYPGSVYLFGSRAKGTQGRFSDIDIAVLPKDPLPEGLLASLREKLADSHIIYTVDVVDLSLVDDDFRNKVLQEGILWKD